MPGQNDNCCANRKSGRDGRITRNATEPRPPSTSSHPPTLSFAAVLSLPLLRILPKPISDLISACRPFIGCCSLYHHGAGLLPTVLYSNRETASFNRELLENGYKVVVSELACHALCPASIGSCRPSPVLANVSAFPFHARGVSDSETSRRRDTNLHQR
jgi:hypothetical protein